MSPVAGSDALRLSLVWQFDGTSCPLCRIAQEAEERFFFWFLRESHCSFPILEALDSSTFCRRHASRLLGGDDPRISATFEALGRKEMLRLAQLREALRTEGSGSSTRRARRDSSGRGVAAQAAALARHEGCLACEAETTAVRGETLSMVPVLGTGDGRETYRAGSGFCRVHLWLVLAGAPRDTAAWLAAEAEERLEDLLEALALYTHRLDYRYRDEPKGAEQTAWKRALRHFWRDPPSR